MATLTVLHLHTNEGPKAKVGDPATILLYSDSHAATVVAVSKSGKTIQIQRDVATRVDKRGMDEAQEYTYERDPNGSVTTFRWTKRGWSNQGVRALVGVRREFYDFTF